MSDEITLKIVLDHIVAMEQRLTGQLADVKRELKSVETNLGRQIQGIDERLDDIEIENLPKRVRALESRV